MPVTLREERPEDREPIHALERAAFPSEAEARLVDALRTAGALTLSLIAEDAGRLVGHLAISPVSIVTADGQPASAVGLGPMAVEPARQRTGIGGRLIEGAMDRLRARGHSLCVVLGHASFYPRHGFVPAAPLRWDHGHAESFFVRELVPGALAPLRGGGVVRYRPEFDEV